MLKDIVKHIVYFNLQGDSNRLVHGITIDSRQCTAQFLFVAIKGTQTDGHLFIDKAIENAASAIVCEDLPEKLNSAVCYIQVADSALAFARLAAAFYDFPSEKLKLIGITGTNGKTSIATLLYELTFKLGYKAGLLSTIKNKINEKEIPATHTTPDAGKINQLLSEMLKAGCEYVFMEVSSHAIDQKRINNLHFSGAIFTNLTHDHLDYHKSFANYRDTKKKFFDNLPISSFSLVNADDKNAAFMQQNTKSHKYSYALHNLAYFKAKVLEYDLRGTNMIIDQKEVWMQLVGKFNASNLLAVYGAARLLNFDTDEVLRAMSALKPVKGRFETLICCKEKLVIIDYAHTPDALENVLQTLVNLREKNTEIYTVFGAGGNRDKTKRPEMGKIVAKYSDRIIITSDNPRNENPDTIIDEIFQAVPPKKRAGLLKILERESAIRTALMMSKPADIILIAGKGHEDYQEINGIRRHFDDKEIVENFNKENKR